MRWYSPLVWLMAELLLLLGVAACGDQASAPVNAGAGGSPGQNENTYTSAQYHFKVIYPAAWFVDVSGADGTVRMFREHSLAAPEAVATDLRCATNTENLSPADYWARTAPQGNGEKPIGTRTLSSGTSAFVAEGQAQKKYTVYTVAKNRTICQLVAYESDTSGTSAISNLVNSFVWE